MSTLTSELRGVAAEKVTVTKHTLKVELADGRAVEAPLVWYPRLLHATAKERSRWRLIGSGEGIHWPDLDEDISVENVLLGHPSGESQRSFRKWLEARRSKNGPRRTQSCILPKSSPKKRIQTAKYAEYAEKWNAFAYFVYSAVLTAFYFGDVFESPTF